MLGLENIPTFLLAATLLIIVPGPATFYVADKARHSIRNASLAVAGIVVGDILLITLSGLGFAALVTKWPTLLLVIKVAGAMYVAWLGIELLRPAPAAIGSAQTIVPTSAGSFRRGLLLTLSNPKPIIFFAAFFPMFIDKTTHSWMQSFYALGGLFEIINLFYFVAITALITWLRSAPAFERFAAGGFNKASGCGLVLCAALILATAY